MTGRSGGKAAAFAARCFAVATVLAVFVPFKPLFPTTGLDPSWKFAVNQAVAQGLVFGKDLVFTYGPYAFIFSKVYHPQTDRLMLLSCLFLGVCYAALLLQLGRGMKPGWLVLCGVALAAVHLQPDPLLLSYPLLLVAAVCQIRRPDASARAPATPGPAAAVTALCFAPLGLLPLVKGNFLLIGLVTAALCFGFLLHQRNRVLACCALTVPVAGALFFWGIVGQPLFALPAYLASLGWMTSGYTEAMSVTGDGREVVLFLLAALALLAATALRKPVCPAARAFLVLSCAFLLFVAFKGGFVRHDGAHAIIAGTFLLLAALILRPAVSSRAASVAALLVVVAWVFITRNYSATVPAAAVSESLLQTYTGAWEGLRSRLAGDDGLRREYDSRLAAIEETCGIPRLPGTTDVYSYQQSCLLAPGNVWSPRPVFQSFAAYTPHLAALNEQHLRGGRAPDTIVFRVESINQRIPALDDGPSWPVLINNYSIARMDGDAAYLRRNEAVPGAAPPREVADDVHEFTEDVALPGTDEPLFARLEITPTLVGRAASFLYKLPHVEISLVMRQGATRSYQLVPEMARSGFLLSPLVAEARDFALLVAGDPLDLADNRVDRLRISVGGGRSVFWNPSYRLRLSTVPLRRDPAARALVAFDQVVEAQSLPPAGPTPVPCEGSLDTANGAPLRPGGIRAASILSVWGWSAVSTEKAVVQERLFVTLTSQEGAVTYIRARSTPRPDVNEYFKRPQLPDTGYAVYADVSGLSGKYVLGLSRVHQGRLERCTLSVPLLIER